MNQIETVTLNSTDHSFSQDHSNRTVAGKKSAIRVGISACLLGQPVRYNGGHSQSRLCLNQFAEHFEYRSFCPELAAGFGVPRPTLRLTGDPSNPRMVYSNQPETDVSGQFKQATDPVIDTLADLDGYILMKNSPSCGLERVKVYRDNGYPHKERVRGLFTEALIKRFPDLPVEEEGRLHDDRLRENFILRVYAHHHFRLATAGQPTLKGMMAFHRDYKYVLMAHNQREYRALGRLLAKARRQDDLLDLKARYLRRFMTAISKPATRGNHCNVLMHILGYLKRTLNSSVRKDIVNIIEQYRRGDVNLATPLTLLSHYVRQFGSEYIQTQRYLQPYPARLGLTNRL